MKLLERRLAGLQCADMDPKARRGRESSDQETAVHKNGREGLPEPALQAPRCSDPEPRTQNDAQVRSGDIRLDLLRDLSSSSHEDPGEPACSL